MKTSVLVIDPDSDWANNLVSYFKERNFEVTHASNGEDAQELISKHDYGIIILDTLTENHSWTTVLRNLKINVSNSMIIITLSNEHALRKMEITNDHLLQLGATQIFLKPIEPSEIFKFLEEQKNFQNWNEVEGSGAFADIDMSEEIHALDREFTHIKLTSFYSGSKTIYDYYLRLDKDRFVRVLKAGENFDSARIKKHQEQEFKYLYFKTKDRTAYINFFNKLLGKLLGSELGSISDKVKITKNVVEKYLEEVYSLGIGEKVIEEGKIVCTNMYNLIMKEPDLNKTMRSYEDYDPDGLGHLFLASFFSVITAQNLDWASQRTSEIIAMGGLLHDVGQLRLPRSIKEKNISLLNDEEMEIYKTHPILGAEMLNKHPIISGAVIQIIFQHHELANGLGFPNKLHGMKIFPPAQILSLCNEYAQFLAQKRLDPMEGLKEFLKDRSAFEKFDNSSIKALIKCFVKEKP